MTVDPYRELAERTRQEMKKVQKQPSSAHEDQPVSRVERKKDKEEKKRYPLLKTLLFFFILLPFLTAIYYTYGKEPNSSTTPVIEKKVHSSVEMNVPPQMNRE